VTTFVLNNTDNKKAVLSQGTTERCGHLYRKRALNTQATQ